MITTTSGIATFAEVSGANLSSDSVNPEASVESSQDNSSEKTLEKVSLFQEDPFTVYEEWKKKLEQEEKAEQKTKRLDQKAQEKAEREKEKLLREKEEALGIVRILPENNEERTFGGEKTAYSIVADPQEYVVLQNGRIFAPMVSEKDSVEPSVVPDGVTAWSAQTLNLNA